MEAVGYMIDIKLLKENPDNPRTIKDKEFNRLKKKIERFPEMLAKRPIVFDSSQDYLILGGNRRFNAVTQLLDENKIVLKDEYLSDAKDWTEEQKREFIVIDNVSDGEWDYDMLANEYEAPELEEWGLELPHDFNAEETVEDEAPELSQEPPVSELGKVYQLGRHRLMCGDATKIEDVEKLMDGQKADMVFTDPPYGMDLDTDWSDIPDNQSVVQGNHQSKNYSKIIGDDKDYDPTHLFTMFPDVKEMILWGADYYAERLLDKNKGSWFVWDKRLEESTDKIYGSCFELAWSKEKHKRNMVRVKWAGVYGTETQDIKKRIHPTQKPIEVCTWFISKYSKQEQKIIDLFGGSGSTLIACEQTNRDCYMLELDEKYVDVIRKRYWKFVNNGIEEGWEESTPEMV
jgi:DNA modification methylase